MAQSDTPTAEKAWRVADDIIEDRDGSLDPPRASVFVGEYCDRFGATVWEARAAAFKAVQREKLDVKWYDCHARVIPATLPPDEAGLVAGGGSSDGISSPWHSDDFSMDSLERDAPTMCAALLHQHAETAAFERAEGFLECARFWDAVELMDEHGVDATTAHAGTVVCRECGLAARDGLDDHLEDEHDMTVGVYREKYPAAPVTLEEAAALPPASMDWTSR